MWGKSLTTKKPKEYCLISGIIHWRHTSIWRLIVALCPRKHFFWPCTRGSQSEKELFFRKLKQSSAQLPEGKSRGKTFRLISFTNCHFIYAFVLNSNLCLKSPWLTTDSISGETSRLYLFPQKEHEIKHRQLHFEGSVFLWQKDICGTFIYPKSNYLSPL